LQIEVLFRFADRCSGKEIFSFANKKTAFQDTYDVSADCTEGRCEVNPFLEKMASSGMGAGQTRAIKALLL
jgi:hypothetical protein